MRDKNKRPAKRACHKTVKAVLALATLHARVFLVDHVNAATTAHQLAVAVSAFPGFQRVLDFHRFIFRLSINNESAHYRGSGGLVKLFCENQGTSRTPPCTATISRI